MEPQELSRALQVRGLDQKDLADHLGVSQGYISMVISGERPLTGERLADARRWLESVPPIGDPLAS